MRTLPTRWQRLSVLRQLTQSASEEQWQAVASLPRFCTTVQIGRLYLKERALVNRTLMSRVPTHGWQFFAVQAAKQRYRTDVVWPRPSLLFPLRSPLGSLLSSSASCFFVASGLPSLSSRTCPCGRPLDVLGHHRAACRRAGVLGSRGFSLESAAARVCREARVSTNLFVRDLDLPIANHDARRLEVVADGLPLFRGAHLAIDTTLVSSVQADGRPRPQCARVDGAALSEARRRKQRTYGRARLVIGHRGGRLLV